DREARVAAGVAALRKRREALEQAPPTGDQQRARCSTCGEFKAQWHTCSAGEGKVVHPDAAAAVSEVDQAHGDVVVTEYVPMSGATCWSAKGPRGTFLVTPKSKFRSEFEVLRSDELSPRSTEPSIQRGIRAAARQASAVQPGAAAEQPPGSAGGGSPRCATCGEFKSDQHSCAPKGEPQPTLTEAAVRANTYNAAHLSDVDARIGGTYTAGMVLQARSGAKFTVAEISPEGLVTMTSGHQFRAGDLTSHDADGWDRLTPKEHAHNDRLRPANGQAGEPGNAERPAGDLQASGSTRCPDCGQYRGSDHTCPTPEGLPDGNYADLKGDERVKAMVADLETSVKAIVESGQLDRWVDAMASNGLNRWSANNRLLATVQILQRGESLEGLHMMGFRQWDKFNRKVSKGAKAVWILAPVTRKVVEEDEDGTKTEKRRVVGFKSVPVFNVSDTHGDPLPESPVRPAPGEATPGTLEGLRDRVGQAGYTYEETEIPGCRPETGDGTLGYTDPQSKRIVVDSRLSNAQKASTIAHELGHVHCGHVDGDYSEYRKHRGRMETEAELTAAIVMRTRGATREQADSFSPGYIASWSKGDPKVMHAAVEKATAASNKILDGHWSTS
ncbi:ImmA/IrrE family metallo-endopeptidase, partial [Nocardioides sp.]|uniref:ImmA/IrrE family metallo-endopeptidase n=1 Tax=Nocardioides sp. TaxID=35761 RepID=UPI002734D5F9